MSRPLLLAALLTGLGHGQAYAQVDGPPLTDRERQLLARVEQLEKRVQDMDARGKPAATVAPEPTVAVPPAPFAFGDFAWLNGKSKTGPSADDIVLHGFISLI